MLAAELARRGDQVSILARGSADPVSQARTVRERLRDGTRVHRLVGGMAEPEPAFDGALEPLVAAALAEATPDVVHVLHLAGLTPTLPELAARRGAALVVSLQDFYFVCPLAHLQKRSGELCAGPDGGRECARSCFADGRSETLGRWVSRARRFEALLALAQRVICPSRYVESYFGPVLADRSRTAVIPNPVADAVLAPVTPNGSRAKERGTLTVAFLGAVCAHKGAHVLLDALARAELPSVDLRLLGVVAESRYAASLRARAETLPRVQLTMHGRYSPVELRGLLADVDCVVAPSQVPETFSITTREALAAGLPVLVSRLGALPEAVAEGENGFVVAHDDPSELALRLRELAFDPALLERLRQGASATRVTTAREHADAVRALYEEALAG
jgi:glycosyltransferase involved in cell wall biosynthesis